MIMAPSVRGHMGLSDADDRLRSVFGDPATPNAFSATRLARAKMPLAAYRNGVRAGQIQRDDLAASERAVTITYLRPEPR